MTDQHPITPPPELVNQWIMEATEPFYVPTQAARWGADQELEACCEWFVHDWTDIETADKLRAARRGPTLQMVKKRALSELAAAVAGGNITPERGAYIRLALEQLPND